MKTLADLLKAKIEELGFEDIKEFARAYDVPYELLRKVISNGHLPKDKTLMFYADHFGMDPSDLIQAAYRQKAPEPVAHLFGRKTIKRGMDVPTDALRNAPVSVAAQDRDLRYVWAYNQRTAPPEGIIGHTDADLFMPADAAHLDAVKKRVLEWK